MILFKKKLIQIYKIILIKIINNVNVMIINKQTRIIKYAKNVEKLMIYKLNSYIK